MFERVQERSFLVKKQICIFIMLPSNIFSARLNLSSILGTVISGKVRSDKYYPASTSISMKRNFIARLSCFSFPLCTRLRRIWSLAKRVDRQTPLTFQPMFPLQKKYIYIGLLTDNDRFHLFNKNRSI